MENIREMEGKFYLYANNYVMYMTNIIEEKNDMVVYKITLGGLESATNYGRWIVKKSLISEYVQINNDNILTEHRQLLIDSIVKYLKED